MLKKINKVAKYMIKRILAVIIKRLGGVIMDKIIAKVLEKIIQNMSDQLRAEIIQFVKRLDEIAKKSANPWDDILVMLLKVALGIE